MKKMILALAVLLSLTAATDVLGQTIMRLRNTVDQKDAKIEVKNTLLACERDARRTVARAMRAGRVVEVPSCR